MRVIAIANQKGGSAKTTTAVSLGAALAEQKSRVLLIDLDPQASASAWLGDEGGEKGLQDVFTNKARIIDFVCNTGIMHLEMVPASSWLTIAERSLAGEPGAELILAKAIRKLPADRWDYVLIDCPPALGLLSVSAMAAADEVLVPVEASSMALAGVVRLRETVEAVQDRLNDKLELAHVLACRVDTRTKLSRDVVASLTSAFGEKVFTVSIRESVRVKEAWGYKEPVLQYAPQCSAAEDYRSVAKELQQRHKSVKREKVAV